MGDSGDDNFDDDTHFDDTDMADEPETAHPRIRERRAEVEVAQLRSRNRKLIALGALVLTGLIGAAATQSALLDVDEVQVVGAVRTSPDQIRDAAAVELGAPLLRFDHQGVEDRLRALPNVESATSTSDWGGTVTIEIEERLPIARVISPEGTILIDDDGIVIEVSSQDFEELPAISGAMFVGSPGEPVPTELTDALIVAESLPPDIEQVTERIEITVDSLVLRLVGGGSASLGDARILDDKYDTVRAFLAQVDLDCLDSLNVRAPRVPVIVRRDNC